MSRLEKHRNTVVEGTMDTISFKEFKEFKKFIGQATGAKFEDIYNNSHSSQGETNEQQKESNLGRPA